MANGFCKNGSILLDREQTRNEETHNPNCSTQCGGCSVYLLPAGLQLSNALAIARHSTSSAPKMIGPINLGVGIVQTGFDAAMLRSRINDRVWDDVLRLSGDVAIMVGGATLASPKHALPGLVIAGAGWIVRAVGALFMDNQL